MATSASPEMAALVGLVRQRLVPSGDEIPDIGTLDATLFQKLAAWHKVEPLIACCLSELLRAPQRDYWSQRLMQMTAEAERVLALQRDVCEALEARQIPVFPLRGLLLARMLHGAIHLRAMADIDLLVPPERAVAAMETLGGMGLKPPLPLNAVQRAAYVHFRTECAFLDADQRLAIDLHWRAMPSSFELIGDAELWASAARAELGGYIFREARPSHQLLLLCSHGAKHGWDRLGYITDLAAAVSRIPEQAVLEARQIAEKRGRTRLWILSLSLVSHVFGPGRWSELLTDEDERAVRNSVELIQSSLFDVGRIGGRGGQERKWLHAICPKWKDRWKYWRETILAPSIIEVSGLSLPRQLWGGYRAIRLARLAGRAFRRRDDGN